MYETIRFVLVRPSHPGNIGSAARAIKNMGFSQLDLVAPRCFPSEEANALASGAQDVLEQARVYPDLPAAIAHADCIMGLSARMRAVPFQQYSAQSAAQYVAENRLQLRQPVFVFGAERTGLENAEMALCTGHVHIPTAQYASLNVGMAVQIMAYDMRLALETLSPAPAPPDTPVAPLATAEEWAGFFAHLEEVLDTIGFLAGNRRTILQRLRRLYYKAQLEQRELHILRGILKNTLQAIKMGKSHNEQQS